MPDPKTYWTIIDSSPTECTIEEPFGGRVVVHPVAKPDTAIMVLWGFVFDDKKTCIQRTLDRLAEYYSEGERDIKARMMQQSQLFHKMEALRKELEECDAEG